MFNNVGPFGHDVEDSWWSKTLNVNFAWNSFFLGWFGANVNGGSDSNENWNDGDNVDDDDEIREL